MTIICWLIFIFVTPSGAETTSAPESVVIQQDTAWNAERQQIMSRLTQFSNQSFGPNCWNTALLVSGLNTSIHYSDGSEFWFWMNSPYCQALPENAELQYGDIGSVFDSTGLHFHSFMRISDSTLFQKGGPPSELQWGTYPHESILFPQFHEEARRCRGNERTQQQNNCRTRIAYHRCQPAPDNLFSRHEELRGFENEIKTIESRILRWMQERSPAQRENFHRDLIRLNSILTQLNAMRVHGDKEFARLALAFRVAGLLFTDVNDYESEPQAVQNARLNAQNFFYRHRNQNTTHEVDELITGPR